VVEPDLGALMSSDPHAATLDGGTASMPAVELGTVLAGRYEVLAILGAGAMGTVLRVHDRELDESLALKVLHADVARAPQALDRFRQEVKLARRVTHRNVARTFELGETAGLRFITMELVEGESLARVIERRGALAAPEAVTILAGICDGLSAAHAASVVHRDIKPENVLLETTGRVVVTDFGIAKQVEPGDASRTQQIVGTPYYMAPEQVEGLAATPRSDLYALGVLAWEMLVGDPPWTGSGVAQVALRRLLEAPPDPRERRPDLAAPLAEAVLRCMARQPEDRFASAIEARDAFVRSVRASVAPQPAARPAQTGALTRQRSLVVLPLRHSGSSEDAYLAEGVADDLSDALSSVKGVRVLSRSTLGGHASDPREIGTKLGLTHVIEGQFRRQDATCRISLRLVEVESGVVAWAQRFELAVDRVLSA
jgi:serine/threonine-protein kinase